MTKSEEEKRRKKAEMDKYLKTKNQMPFVEFVLSGPLKGVTKCWAIWRVQGVAWTAMVYLRKPKHVPDEVFEAFIRACKIGVDNEFIWKERQRELSSH